MRSSATRMFYVYVCEVIMTNWYTCEWLCDPVSSPLQFWRNWETTIRESLVLLHTLMQYLLSRLSWASSVG